ncbi:MAG: hypothetical protein GY817_08355 [bacterium]|nr:hypothetical protein [bacterium]
MSLVNELIKGLLPEEEKKKVVAVYGGGFKPPTSGHFEVVKQALKENPEIDEMIILIGGKPRNGITPDESILIWDIYKTYLPFKVEVKYTSVPPIKGIYNYAKEHPDEEVLFIIGAREGNEDDFADIATRTKSLDKYPNLNLRTIVTQGGVSGTAARNASKISLEKFKPFVPSELSDKEVEQVYNIVADKITEGRKKKKDPKKGTGKKPKKSGRRLYTDEDPKDTVGIKFSTRQDIVDTLNKTSFKAKSHARQSQIINLIHQRVRAAYGRSKDPAVKKRLKTGLDYITKKKEASKAKTQRLKKLNENNEANELESLLNRWSAYSGQYDLLPDIAELAKNLGVNNGPSKVYRAVPGLDEYPYTKQEVIDYDKEQEIVATTPTRKQAEYFITNNADWAYILEYKPHIIINFDEFEEKYGWSGNWGEGEILIDVTKSKLINIEDYIKKQSINENASYSQHIDVQDKIDQLTQHMIDKGMNIEPLPTLEFVDGDSENASDFFGKTAYYDPNKQHIVLYTEGRHPKDIVRSYAHEMIHHIQYLEDRLGDVAGTDTTSDDHLDKIEQEANLRGTMTFRNWTDSILNEAIVGEKIKCDKCGWSWNIVDGGDDLFICHKCGHDNEQIEENKDPFGLNAYARELGQLNEKVMDYKIYCDMDGVLVDFERGYEKLTGIDLRGEFQKGEDFWDPISKAGVGFWAGLKWMPDGQKLWNYLKPYKPDLLSAPSREDSSRIGKHVWVKHKIPGTKLILRYAKQKQELATPESILIDDRQVNIDQWEAAGGIGILHTSADNTIKQLKQLGL